MCGAVKGFTRYTGMCGCLSRARREPSTTKKPSLALPVPALGSLHGTKLSHSAHRGEHSVQVRREDLGANSTSIYIIKILMRL